MGMANLIFFMRSSLRIYGLHPSSVAEFAPWDPIKPGANRAKTGVVPPAEVRSCESLCAGGYCIWRAAERRTIISSPLLRTLMTVYHAVLCLSLAALAEL